MKNKNLYTTRPNAISYLYFLIIYFTIIKVGNFNKKKKILDFGSGLGNLKKLNNKLKNPSKIINYDRITHLSDIKRWDNQKFDTIVFCQSAYMLSKKELNLILNKIKKTNPKIEIIVALSTRSFLNRVMSKLLGHSDAYTGLKLNPNKEEQIFLSKCKTKNKINFLNLFKIFVFKFK